MRRIIAILLTGILFLTACGQSATAPQATPTPIVEQATSTPTFLPTSTQTSIPSPTLTASVTPLPTIPTFTPTFDASTIVTVTPAPKAECPVVKEGISINLPDKKEYIPDRDELENEYTKPILKYLNSGGNPTDLLKKMKNQYCSGKCEIGELTDMTNDDVDEIIIGYPAFIVYSCQGKEYAIIFQKGLLASHTIYDDITLNNIPELVSASYPCSNNCLELTISEWHGAEFQTITHIGIDGAYGRGFEFKDLDGDGLRELIIMGDILSWTRPAGMIPNRIKTINYTWNGQSYIEDKIQFDTPEYRFQAIQDADREVLYGNYDLAIGSYQDAIFSDKLDWWSREKQKFIDNTFSQRYESTPVIFPTPITDSAEYPRLAAYAYYRIILLHLVQNQESEATTTYNTLQEKFRNDPYARPYVEMATAFWNAYQSTHKMYDGCAAAIQYAVEHPEILIPLGSDYHGAQSHTYVPADVCPFR